ncbi:MAG TPA: MFS transporter [Blastocatellia bacterium]|nr:MFS transporter [Blastocatellia bacterium]
MMKRRSYLLLVSLAYLSFISLGLPDGLLGVAWPSIRAYFDLPIDALGALLVMFTSGYLLSSFISGRLLARMSVGALLALSCLATAASLLGYAAAPFWWVMVALGALSGLGAGAIDAGLNTYAATHFSARTVNWLHAFYGVGATIGPVIMTGVIVAGSAWQMGYVIVGVFQLLLAACFGLTRAWWKDGVRQDAPERASTLAASNRSTLRLPVVWLSIAVFFFYTGLEAAAGAWAYSLFTEARGVSASSAGMWVSAYWGCLTAGRLLSGIVVGFVPVRALLRACMILIALGAAMIWLNLASLMSFLGLGLIGLASAPIFPSLIATTPARLGEAHAANGVGFQIAAAVLGQSLLPAAVGMFARSLGLEIVGPALLLTALALFGFYEALMAAGSSRARETDRYANSRV